PADRYPSPPRLPWIERPMLATSGHSPVDSMAAFPACGSARKGTLDGAGNPMPGNAGIEVVDTVTKLDERHVGRVVIGASHGGIYAAYCAARGGVLGVILNDAGVGLDRAGIAALAWLD